MEEIEEMTREEARERAAQILKDAYDIQEYDEPYRYETDREELFGIMERYGWIEWRTIAGMRTGIEKVTGADAVVYYEHGSYWNDGEVWWSQSSVYWGW